MRKVAEKNNEKQESLLEAMKSTHKGVFFSCSRLGGIFANMKSSSARRWQREGGDVWENVFDNFSSLFCVQTNSRTTSIFQLPHNIICGSQETKQMNSSEL
jgi:hypothetical protein